MRAFTFTWANKLQNPEYQSGVAAISHIEKILRPLVELHMALAKVIQGGELHTLAENLLHELERRKCKVMTDQEVTRLPVSALKSWL
jgi:hypothetical protein